MLLDNLALGFILGVGLGATGVFKSRKDEDGEK